MTGTTNASDRRDAVKWRIAGWGLAALVLLTPLVAMRFTDAVNWGTEDVLAAGLLLGGALVAVEVAMRLIHAPVRRVMAALVILAMLALIWAEVAVGIFH